MIPAARYLRLPHKWRLIAEPPLSAEIVREFIRPAIRAVPQSMTRRLPLCVFLLVPSLEEEDVVSHWTETEDRLELTVATEGVEPHDVALELLVCLGQALWERATSAERTGWLQLLGAEVEAGVTGEIDEDALRARRELLSSRVAARSMRRLQRYAGVSFASTVAEYIHCMWHDVTVRIGLEHLPAEWLRGRLELMVRFFPPDRGQRVIGQEEPRSSRLRESDCLKQPLCERPE
jgi:hypothetical protein